MEGGGLVKGEGMKIDYPIPAIMKNRPVDDRGYVIPYFVPIVNGKPDFRYQDPKKREACLKHSLCSVCGNKLYSKSYWFISGPMGLMNRIHSDAPMHEDCARYSLAVCPHLHLYKAERRSDGSLATEGQVRDKPKNLFIVKADKYESETFGPNKYIRFRPVYTEEYSYEDNKLVRVNHQQRR